MSSILFEKEIIKGKTDEGPFFRVVAIQSNNVQACLDVMRRNGIKNLAFNSAWGWNAHMSIDLIKDNTWIEGVSVVDNNVDIDVLNSLVHLKRLTVADKFKGVLDFNNFHNLEVFNAKWNEKQFKNIDKLRHLKYLSTARFNRPDLSFFRNFRELKKFQLAYSNISRLDGIEGLRSLQALELINVPKLTDISALASLKPSLTSFIINGGKKIENYSAIGELDNLDTLYIYGGAPIQSVGFLEKMKLKEGNIEVEILDKKTDVLVKKGISYKKYKSYSS